MGGFSVTKFFPTDELLQLSLCRCSSAFNEFSLESFIWCVGWGSEKEICHFCSDLRAEGTDNMVKPGRLTAERVGGTRASCSTAGGSSLSSDMVGV